MDRPWKGTVIASPPTLEAIAATLSDYEAMLLSILDVVLERFERNPGYRFVDTKLDLRTGRDHPELPDRETDFKGRTAVYGWIQGRGLEALAGHANWIARGSFLPAAEKESYRRRLTAMAGAVVDQMEEIRGRLGDHLPFVLTPDGRPFDRGSDGRRRYFEVGGDAATTSDLFYGKGLFSAARLLQRPEQMVEGARLFRLLTRNVADDRCQSDQIAFDPRNRRPSEPGKRQHGWRMISILGYAVFAEALGEDAWFEGGERFIREVLDRHVNLGQWPEFEHYDFVEEIDAEGNPWRANGAVVSDPGHVLEFIGLAAKFLLLLQDKPTRTRSQDDLLRCCREVLPRIMLQSFRLGFNRRGGGICKSFDLVGRTPLSGEMPWWNLPETLRAAAELLVLFPDDPHAPAIRQILADCSNAFVTRFVNRGCHLMAYQTLDVLGHPVDSIPATPDADPGYHTGLSVIDFIHCIQRLQLATSDAGSR